MKDEGLREKAIKGLECCILRDPDDHARCSQCQYESNCVNRLKMDALELLKEQEAKRVIGIADSIEGMEVGYCPSCDRTIVNKKIDKTKFCKFCGQAVKWND